MIARGSAGTRSLARSMQYRRRRQAAAAAALQILCRGVPPGREFPERSLQELFGLRFPSTTQPLEESTESASAL